VSEGLLIGQSATPRPLSLPDHIHRLLEDAIISGQLHPGQRVSENELARAFEVSRTPVREAVRILEGEGLIIRRRNKGMFIAARTSRQEARALYELRVPLEAFLTQVAAEHITSKEIATLIRLQRRFGATLAHDDAAHRRQLVDLDSEFHFLIYRASRSDLSTIVDSYWGRLRRELSGRAYQGKPPAQFSAQHNGIILALQARDGEQAGRLMSDHVRTSWQAVATSFTIDATEESGGTASIQDAEVTAQHD
jgi:DNA-binding GntR family transcriptional regulator